VATERSTVAVAPWTRVSGNKARRSEAKLFGSRFSGRILREIRPTASGVADVVGVATRRPPAHSGKGRSFHGNRAVELLAGSRLVGELNPALLRGDDRRRDPVDEVRRGLDPVAMAGGRFERDRSAMDTRD